MLLSKRGENVISKSRERNAKRYIESLLEDYPHYDEYVAQRRFELQHPYVEPDDNVGGGKSSSSTPYQERWIITLDEDKRLNALRQEHSAIRTCFEEAPDDVQTICKELYFKPSHLRSASTIADLATQKKILVSRAEGYRLWNNFIFDVANELHLPM